MATPQRYLLSVDVGANTEVQTLAAALNDISTVCTFAGELQRASDRNVAIVRALRRADPELFDLDFPWSRLALGTSLGAAMFETSPEFNSRVDRYLEGTDEDAIVTVEELTYENPVELIIAAGGAVVLAVLRLVRDWPARRALNDAVVDDYRNTAQDRAQARRIVLRQLETGKARLSTRQVDELLRADVLDAMSAVGDRGVHFEQLPGPDDQPHLDEPE